MKKGKKEKRRMYSKELNYKSRGGATEATKPLHSLFIAHIKIPIFHSLLFV